MGYGMNEETVGGMQGAAVVETVDHAALALVPIEAAQGGFAVLVEEYGLRGMLPGQLRAWLREHFPALRGNALTGAVSDCVAGYRTESIRHATQEYVKALRAGGVPAGKYTRGGQFYNVRVEIPKRKESPVELTAAEKASKRILATIGKLSDADKTEVLNGIVSALPAGV